MALQRNRLRRVSSKARFDLKGRVADRLAAIQKQLGNSWPE
jgi:hypothetical protein